MRGIGGVPYYVGGFGIPGLAISAYRAYKRKKARKERSYGPKGDGPAEKDDTMHQTADGLYSESPDGYEENSKVR